MVLCIVVQPVCKPQKYSHVNLYFLLLSILLIEAFLAPWNKNRSGATFIWCRTTDKWCYLSQAPISGLLTKWLIRQMLKINIRLLTWLSYFSSWIPSGDWCLFTFCVLENVGEYLAVHLHILPEILAEVARQTGDREMWAAENMLWIQTRGYKDNKSRWIKST